MSKIDETLNEVLGITAEVMPVEKPKEVSKDPRAYEVAGQLIKTVSEVSQNLLDLQEKLKKVKEVPNTGPKNVTNALFVGSTTELQKMLKEKK